MSRPSPFTVTKDGSHFEVKVDAHYVSDEEAEMVRRYIADLNAENAKLRELCGRALVALENNCGVCAYFYDCNIMNDCKCVAPKKIRAELRELGIEVD